ncbi:hypothetical protein [Chryseobacterium schmidteae]|uniref:hypothetical protein n=1 Tax=Chryseobacterium schmidteae TaxID=2730404 RepID=UPI00158869E9|nr:hypothetical protein [Chryseobacterium schmidteae]
MRTIRFIILSLTLGMSLCKGQVIHSEENRSAQILKEVNKSKTGNWKDVFADFGQLAFKDLTGEKKAFQIKTSLYALKVRADSSQFTDANYEQANFTRNFQIEIGANLDNDYKFKGFTYGADWTIINKRDLSVNTLYGSNEQNLYTTYSRVLIESKAKYYFHLVDTKDSELEAKMKKLDEAIAMNSDKYVIPIDNFPKDFVTFLPDNFSETSIELEKTILEKIEEIKLQPLLSVGFRNTIQEKSKLFDKYKFNLVYLHGLKSLKNMFELDVRSEFNAKDSIGVNQYIKRREWNSQIGLNIQLLKQKEVSLVEFKPNFEFKRVFSGLMDEEKNNQFLANADLRFRVLKNLWIPLVLKYDIVNNNFFGFLNVSFNFDAIKND